MDSKIALVTGGSRGLGKEIALSLAKLGTDIIITYYTKQIEALEVVKEIETLGQKAAIVQLDVGKTTSFVQFIDDIKTLLNDKFSVKKCDYLINNAGIGINIPFESTSEEQFDMLLNIHFKGVFFLTQHMLPYLNEGGSIVNLSSGLARFSNPGYAAYGSMKGAVETLTKYMAKELGPKHIRVNVVAPGAIATDFGGGMVRDNKNIQSFIVAQTPLGRVGQPHDIGGVVAFLCSDAAKWITGQRIEVSGGIML